MTISLCIANETDDDRVDLGGVTVDGQTAELNTSDLGRPHRILQETSVPLMLVSTK